MSCARRSLAEIVDNREVRPGCFAMRLADGGVAAQARPGQFVHVRVPGPSLDPLLRRPFSVCLADPARGEFTVMYEVAGRVTSAMARMRQGDRLDVLGPLGRGFESPRGGSRVVLVAGGLGIAPLVMLSRALADSGNDFSFIAGARSASMLVGLELVPAAREESRGSRRELLLATEDGSAGLRGTAVDALGRLLDAGGFTCVYACGPVAMLREVARLAYAHGIPAQVSLEERMACGIGACLGCAVRARAGAGAVARDGAVGPVGGEAPRPSYLRACSDGPVFWASEVDLGVLA